MLCFCLQKNTFLLLSCDSRKQWMLTRQARYNRAQHENWTVDTRRSGNIKKEKSFRFPLASSWRQKRFDDYLLVFLPSQAFSTGKNGRYSAEGVQNYRYSLFFCIRHSASQICQFVVSNFHKNDVLLNSPALALTTAALHMRNFRFNPIAI